MNFCKQGSQVSLYCKLFLLHWELCSLPRELVEGLSSLAQPQAGGEQQPALQQHGFPSPLALVPAGQQVTVSLYHYPSLEEPGPHRVGGGVKVDKLPQEQPCDCIKVSM